MTSTPVEVGTLIVVILKAATRCRICSQKNLPNKRHIGKQDPYCSVKLNNEIRRTKAIKRGGQHPEWDEEVRFTILEDVEDELARTATENGTDESPPPPPPKKDKKKIKTIKKMQIMCYADDPREPDLIGETLVDLTEVLTKGETDEWFTLTNKEKYCGEVYLELTFWSNEKPPEKRAAPQGSSFHPQYGGPGSFTPSTEVPMSLTHGNGNHSPSRVQSGSSTDVLPPSLRPSGSLAQINLYSAPYEQRNRHNDVDQLSNVMADLGVNSASQRRESFPPVRAEASEFGYAEGPIRPNGSFSTMSSSGSLSSLGHTGSQLSQGHHRNSFPSSYEPFPHSDYTAGSQTLQSRHRDSLSSLHESFAYDYSPGSRPSQGHHRNSLSSLPEPFPHDGYTSGLPHSMPPMSEGYPAQPSHSFQQTSSGFVQPPPVSQPPVSSQFTGRSSATLAMPSGLVPSQPTSSAMNFHSQQPQPPQQYPTPSQTPFQYPTYSQPPAPAPAQQYLPHEIPLPPPSIPPVSHTISSSYVQHETPSPPQQNQQGLPPPNAYQQMQPNFPTPQSSRPLPNPQVQHQSRSEYHLTSTGFTSPPPGPPPPIGAGNGIFPNVAPFQPPGPPPPPPRRGTSLPPTPTKTPAVTYPPPPPPPVQNGVHQPQLFHLSTPPPPPSQFFNGHSPSPSPHGSQSPQPHPSQPYSPWAPPPPPPPPAGSFPSPPLPTPPSNFSTPPPHGQPPYQSGILPVQPVQYPVAQGWSTPPRQNPPQHIIFTPSSTLRLSRTFHQRCALHNTGFIKLFVEVKPLASFPTGFFPGYPSCDLGLGGYLSLPCELNASFAAEAIFS
ncbi:hypothetical protein K439DRAFT_1610299 [Ramaria rubella]|nr:hypothetical protein K439DRAFT_1610299 [Ramaria rubella]